jgi:hypothetical protein
MTGEITMTGTQLTPDRITAAKRGKTSESKDIPVKITEPEDPWADIMVESEIAPAFVRGPRVVDVPVPPSIAIILEQSLAEWNMEFPDPKGKVLVQGTAKFRTIDAKTISKAKEFLVLAKSWARNRDDGQVSVRAFLVKNGTAETSVVKFAAMPLVKNEVRAMTAANGAPSSAVRKWAVENGMTVPTKGKLKPEVFEAYNAANPASDPNQGTIDEVSAS